MPGFDSKKGGRAFASADSRLLRRLLFYTIALFLLTFPGTAQGGDDEIEVFMIKGFPLSGDDLEYEAAVAEIESNYPDLFGQAEFHIYDYTGNQGQIFTDVQNSTATKRAVVAYSYGTAVLKSLVEQGNQFQTIVTLDGWAMPNGPVTIDFEQHYDANGFEDYRVVNLTTDTFLIHGDEHTVDPDKSHQEELSVDHGDLLRIATGDLGLIRWASRFTINPSSGGGAPSGDGGGGAASSSGAGVESKPISNVQSTGFRVLSQRRYYGRSRVKLPTPREPSP